MDQRLSELYEGVAVHATADREHLAALELLTLVMLADAHLSDDELGVLKELTEAGNIPLAIAQLIQHALRGLLQRHVKGLIERLIGHLDAQGLIVGSPAQAKGDDAPWRTPRAASRPPANAIAPTPKLHV